MTYDIELKGCAPVPLAHYLKALGVLRLVAEQMDADTGGFWRGDTFVLRSKFDKDSLSRFILHDYRPTAIVAPWNGGSGFYFQEEKLKEKDPLTSKRKKTGQRTQPTAATRVVAVILASSTPRLAAYRETLKIVKDIVAESGLIEKPAPKSEAEQELIQKCRNRLPDQTIAWLDASVVLTEEKQKKCPPLLGTGGNDGNAEFSSNFMQRLCEIMKLEDGTPTDRSASWLDAALFGTTIDDQKKGVVIGQFFPAAAGGDNAGPGFESESLVNPWDFVLMIEGALFFAGAAVKRLETNAPGVLSFPFSVRSSGVGYGSASQADETTEISRAEMWVPLWDRATTMKEVGSLMSEGRAQVGKRNVRNGVDFARAVATLGIDRGISTFQRYGFQVRNGRLYFAIPLGRFQVSRQPQVDLLSDVDRWLDTFTGKAISDKAPASANRALRGLEGAILTLCKGSVAARVQDVLIALGECERALVRSMKWTTDSFIHPVPRLSQSWLKEADDGSPEYRLAASLASVYGQYRNKEGQKFRMHIRAQLEPTHTWMKDGTLGVGWSEDGMADVVWSDGDPVRALNAVMLHRVIRSVQSGADTYPDRSIINAEIGDIADFIEGRIDLQRVTDLLWGLMLLDWSVVTENALTGRDRSDAIFPGAGYGLMKLCFPGREVRGVKIPLVPEIHWKASHGDGAGATQLAVRRLRGSGLTVPVESVYISRELTRRTAAALLFPVSDKQITHLANRVLGRSAENDAKEV